MADKPFPWFRTYNEAAFDPKFDIIASQLGLDPLFVFGAWMKILCIAGGSPVRGSLYVTVVKRYSNGDVTNMLRTSNETCNALMNSFIELDMIDQIKTPEEEDEPETYAEDNDNQDDLPKVFRDFIDKNVDGEDTPSED